MRSLALLFVAVVGLVAFEGCGSDTSTNKKADAGLSTAGASGAAGASSQTLCNPNFCSSGCCATATQCGVNTPNGCVMKGPDAGAH